jgi:hypothetical protein
MVRFGKFKVTRCRAKNLNPIRFLRASSDGSMTATANQRDHQQSDEAELVHTRAA